MIRESIDRRLFLKTAGAAAAGAVLGNVAQAALEGSRPRRRFRDGEDSTCSTSSRPSTGESGVPGWSARTI